MFWIDATVRFKENAQNLSHLFSYVLSQTKGAVLFRNNPATHANGVVIHPMTYTYLPSDQQRQGWTSQYGGGTQLLYRTKWVMENIMYWFHFCALDRYCIAPPGAQSNCKRENMSKKYWDCHRFDQTVINLLLSNAFTFDTTNYVYPGDILKIDWWDPP